MLKLLVGDMLENLSKYNVVLASNSPRRKELLSGLGIPHEVKTLPEIDESFPEGLDAEEMALIEESRLLTLKPIIYVANITEDEVGGDYVNNPGYIKLSEHAKSEGSEIIAVSAQIEAELAELEGEEKQGFLDDLGIDESGLDKLIKSGSVDI